METQSYATHRKYVTLYHRVLFPILALTLAGAAVNLTKSWGDHTRWYSAALIFVLTACVLILAYLARVFALKAQDRAIRAEESLRHYVLTGSLPDARLTTRQIVGLRFASDAELPNLANRAAEQGLTEDQIKRAVTSWRADHYRV